MQELETIAVGRFIIGLIVVVTMGYAMWATSHQELNTRLNEWLIRSISGAKRAPELAEQEQSARE